MTMSRAMALLGLTACAGLGNTVWEDRGEVCLGADAADEVARVDVDVDFIGEDCIGETTVHASGCELALSEDELVVTSYVEWSQSEDQRRLPSCGSMTTSCSLSGVPAGSYTVRHGDDTFTLDVGDGSRACSAGADTGL